jgi:biotin transport system substrate-specific component
MKPSTTRKLTIVSLFIGLTAAGSFIKIPFPLVPFSMQSFFPLLAGALLPPRMALATQAGYLLLGLVGLPVFSQGGGLSYVLKPTFGYLLALPLAAFSVSHALRATDDGGGFLGRYGILMAASLLILAIGAGYFFILSRVVGNVPVSLHDVFLFGFIIFIPIEMIKSVMVAYLAPRIEKRIKGRSSTWRNM